MIRRWEGFCRGILIRETSTILGQLEKIKAIPYSQLKDRVLRDDQDAYEVVDGNTTYDIEIMYYWDSGKPGDIRVFGAISESGGWGSYIPHTEDFIIRSDGSLIE